MRQSVGAFVARVHKKVNEVSQTYLTNERRYNYTTPKSFLEQIKLYEVTYLVVLLVLQQTVSENKQFNRVMQLDRLCRYFATLFFLFWITICCMRRGCYPHSGLALYSAHNITHLSEDRQ